jgi:tetratricopeptide (TPR) repeat protein
MFYDRYRRGLYAEALEMVKQHRAQGELETQQMYVPVYAELGNLDKAREHWEKCRQLDPSWSADKAAQFYTIWNFDPAVRSRYLQSIAKAGYHVTPGQSNSEWK